MRGVLSALPNAVEHDLVEKARSAPSMAGLDLATRVSTAKSYKWHEGVEPVSKSEKLVQAGDPLYHVVAYDFGIKRNILRKLVQSGTRVTVVPGTTSAEDVLGLKPDGVFLSNGPGDPGPLEQQQAQVRKLIGKTPIFGICLGHQILAHSLGGKTFKLKFGHRGANHPVLNKITNKVEITSHNHGFAVDPDSLHPHHRRRPDRHRAGGGVRLFGDAGLQGAEGGGLSGHPGQLEPGDDHDRSGAGRRHLYRADHARDRRQDHREGAARRGAADHGRADGAEHRAGAVQGRHAGPATASS
jgi:hypothetical protein